MAHILLVDDDDIIADHVAQVLIDAGHACGWVSDTKAALKVISQRKPDLVLLDHALPGENGTALLRRLRTSPEFYDLPVVMLTSATGFKEEQIALYSGAQDYIRKPFGARMLVFRVNQVLKARAHKPSHRTIGQRVGAEPDERQAMPRMRMI